MKSTRRKKILEEKRKRKGNILKASGTSNYAQKRKWLDRHGLFGFQVGFPKPWKTSD